MRHRNRWRIFRFMHVALTIAGSDSGGGAGIQADLKTFHQFGVFGTSAITAITAQNTLGVTSWEPVSPELLSDQIDVLAADLRPEALKTGMIGTAELIRVVANSLRRHDLKNYVLDPVMVATSGDVLIDAEGARAMKHDLVPLAALVTPNSEEATALTGEQISDETTMRRAAERLVVLGAKAALITGGHLRSAGDATIVDLLYDGEFTLFTHPRIETSSTHGTGCTLSAAIVAQLAQGVPLRDSVRTAIDYVHAAIESAPQLGSGHGPLNHFARGKSVTKERTSD
jgi:hydroxymethylpyrimidine/phosphomethylpyrimidine kinase